MTRITTAAGKRRARWMTALVARLLISGAAASHFAPPPGQAVVAGVHQAVFGHAGGWWYALALLVVAGLTMAYCRRRPMRRLEAAWGAPWRALRATLRRPAAPTVALRFAEDSLALGDVAHLAQRLIAATDRVLDMRAELWVAEGSDPAPLSIDLRLLEASGERVFVLAELRDSGRHPEVAAALGAARLDACVLLRGRRRVVGLLMLRGAGRRLRDAERTTLAVLATQAALAIENLRLHDDLTRSLALVERANRLASIGLLASGFAHEVRSPLVPIRTFAQLLPERWNDADFRGEFCRIILSEVDRMGGLVNDLLSLTGGQRSPHEPATLAEVVGSIMPLLVAQAKTKGVEIEVSDVQASATVAANVEQVRQAAMHLVLSAIEATPAGGRVRIVAGRDETADTPRAYLRVADSSPRRAAPGAAPPHLRFDPRGEGTALGLAIARQIVREHGGTFAVDAAPGRGASFTIEFPVAPPAGRAGAGSS